VLALEYGAQNLHHLSPSPMGRGVDSRNAHSALES
jgi:hypothetical protein